LPCKSLTSIIEYYYMWKDHRQIRAAAQAAEGGRGREQTQAGLHPHLVSPTRPGALAP
ncbi:unnamed protein product, partial [Tetraodon nigroviridis]